MRIIKFITITLIALFGISFACLNAQLVSINYYLGILQIPLSFLLALTLILGSFLGVLTLLYLFLHQKAHQLRLEHRLRLAEKELANLRALPLKETE